MSSFHQGCCGIEACSTTGVKSVRGLTASLSNSNYSSKILRIARSRRCGTSNQESCEGLPIEPIGSENLKKSAIQKMMKIKKKKNKRRRSNEVTAARLPSTRFLEPIEYELIINQLV